MKIKTKVTTEVQTEIKIPAYYKHPEYSWYYAIFTEDETDEAGGVIVRPLSFDMGYSTTVAYLLDDKIPCTREEFFEALNKVIGKVKWLEEATNYVTQTIEQ